MYDYPVKYVDGRGKIRDKKSDVTYEADNELKDSYAFMTDNNDIKTHFPKQMAQNAGVMLKYNDVCVETAPLTDTARQSALSAGAQMKTVTTGDQNERDEIIYENIFGEHTQITYYPRPDGYKENIVLSENNGINKFSYKINTGGLKLEKDGGALVLSEPETGNARVTIGKIMLYDSKLAGDQEPSEAQLEAENAGYNHYYDICTVAENSEYIITINADSSYLNDPGVQYPVVIDPSYSYIFEEGTASAPLARNILDATISKGKPNTNYGSAKTLIIGNYNERYPNGAAYGRCRTAISFSTLKSRLSYMDVPLSAVTSAQLFLKTIHQQSDGVTIKASKMTGSWNEDKITANNGWDLRGANISSRTVKGDTGTNKDGTAASGYWFTWDVLDCIKDGITGSITSIMLCAATTTDKAKEFASCQYTETVSSRPYIKVSYNIPVTSITLDITSAELLPYQSFALNAAVAPYNATNPTFTFTSNNPEVATVDRTGVVTAQAKDGNATITATANDGSGVKAVCNVKVKYLYKYSKNREVITILPYAATIVFDYSIGVNYYPLGDTINIVNQSICSYYIHESNAFWFDIQSPIWTVAKSADGSIERKFNMLEDLNVIVPSNAKGISAYINREPWQIPAGNSYTFSATFAATPDSIEDLAAFTVPYTAEVTIP